MKKNLTTKEEQVLFEFNRGETEGYPIKVTSVVDDEGLKYDIRNFYTDKKSGDILPGPKGVRFEVDYLADIISSMLNDCVEKGDTETIKSMLDKCSDNVKQQLGL